MSTRFDAAGSGSGPGTAALEEVLQHVETLQQQLDAVTTQLHELQRQDQRLRDGLRELNGQMDRARRLQQDLLPRRLPTCPGLKLSKLFLPATELSGDMYDIIRLRDDQLAIHLTDATGHGMAAAMLSIFLKQSLRGRAGADADAPAGVLPDAQLLKLNHEILDMNLTECDFITSIHAVYDPEDRSLLWSRGGMPYPILIRRDRPPQPLVSQGGLIGAFKEQHYDLVSTQLQPGDLLLLYTDGLEALLLNVPANRDVPTLLQTPWVQSLTPQNLPEHFEQIEQLVASMPADGWPIDDITLVALQGTELPG